MATKFKPTLNITTWLTTSIKINGNLKKGKKKIINRLKITKTFDYYKIFSHLSFYSLTDRKE